MCVCVWEYSHIVWVECAAGFAKVLPFRDVSYYLAEGEGHYFGGGEGHNFFLSCLGEGHIF